MDRLKVFGIVALAVLVTASAASSKTVVRFGLNFDLGFPQDEFRDNVDNAAVGGGFFLSVGLPNMPFAIGASGDYMLLGSEDREAPFSHTVPDVFVDVTTKYNLAAGHLTFRMQPELGFWEPYIEALVGFHYLWTRTTVSDQGGDSEEIASTKHCSSWAFSYGVATGVMITLYEFPEGFFDEGDSTDTGLEEDDPSEETGSTGAEEEPEVEMRSIGLFADVRYLKGGEADYLSEGSITIEGGQAYFDVHHSRTDMIAIRIGLSFTIW